MKGKNIITTIIITIVITIVLIVVCFSKGKYLEASKVYQVYLSGKYIGMIKDDNELYKIINDNQQKIKEKYNVDTVYPPNNFEIVEKYTYDTNLSTAQEIYNSIEELDDFTIKGYTISIKPNDDEKEAFSINVTEKDIFQKALNKFISAFVSPEKLDAYMNNMQGGIVDTGSIIEDMYFNEKFLIKESLISVNDLIFTDDSSLSQYLLFGNQDDRKYYTVKAGDTISSISEANKLNTEEFLIANPKYDSVDNLLAINDSVNITLINPLISLTYQLYKVSDEEQFFEKKTVYDNSKPSSYSQITQSGVTGIIRMTQRYNVTNGEQSQGIENISQEVLREKVDQITTKGKRYSAITGTYINPGSGWGWPTNSGYIITSPFAYRWGSMHDGVDISGTGKNSPIYAANDGVVVGAYKYCRSCSYWSLGNYVVIRHDNNYYTMYAHLNSISVSVGQSVSKGTVVGKMGETGRATGVHLHFSASIGEPYSGSYKFFNPLNLYR